MCAYKHSALTLALTLSLAACSSKKSAGGGDGGPDVPSSRDTRVLPFDTLPIDRYVPGDVAKEGPIGREGGVDVRDTGPGREVAADVRDVVARDTLDASDDAPVGFADARDTFARLDVKDAVSSEGGKVDTQVVSLDASKDVNKDTGITRLDAAPDTPSGNSCSTAIQIDTERGTHFDIPFSTTGGSHHFDIPCAQGGNDIVFWFPVMGRELIYADTFGSGWNTVLSLSPACPVKPMSGTPPEGMVFCNDDACGGQQSQIVTVLTSGMYYLVVSGANGESGEGTLHFQHAEVGNGPLVMIPAGAATYEGVTGSEPVGSVDQCESPAPDNSYWWLTCPDYAGGALTASTCEGTSFDTVLNLQVPRTGLSMCNDDDESCGVKSRSSLKSTVPAGAGINVVTVDGSIRASSGAYRLVLTRP
jgi:hypothetical protein